MIESEPARVPVLVSEEEFLALPESMQRVELIDGEVIVGPSPTFWHQDAAKRLTWLIEAWSHSHPPVYVGQSPLDVRIGPSRIVRPDLAVWLDGLSSTAMPLSQVPDVVVEVLSGDRVHDRVTKRFLYAEAGVREYWIVDPAHRGVEVLRGAGLTDGRMAADLLESPLLPGLSVRVPPLFARL